MNDLIQMGELPLASTSNMGLRVKMKTFPPAAVHHNQEDR